MKEDILNYNANILKDSENDFVTYTKDKIIIVKKNAKPIETKIGNYINKIRVSSSIYDDYLNNYVKPIKIKNDIILSNTLIITKKRIKDNSNNIIMFQNFYKTRFLNLQKKKLLLRKLPIIENKENYIEKIMIFSTIYNDYLNNYIKPIQFKKNVYFI